MPREEKLFKAIVKKAEPMATTSANLAAARKKKQVQLNRVSDKMRAGPGQRPATKTSSMTKKPTASGVLGRIASGRQGSSAPPPSRTTAHGSSNGDNSNGVLAKLRTRRERASSSRSGEPLHPGQRVDCTWRQGGEFGDSRGRFVGRVIEVTDAQDGGQFFVLRDKQGVEFHHHTPFCSVVVG